MSRIARVAHERFMQKILVERASSIQTRSARRCSESRCRNLKRSPFRRQVAMRDAGVDNANIVGIRAEWLLLCRSQARLYPETPRRAT
jgi:hypothetical protein